MTRFHNDPPTPHGGVDALRWLVGRDRGAWPAPTHVAPAPFTPHTGDGLRVTFVNHATVLLEVDGIAVLTDPIWSERCSPTQLAGPRRFQSPGVAFDDLPKIDVVLLSHDHYDHLDAPTIRRLARRNPETRFLAGLGNGGLLRRLGADFIDELAWGNAVPLAHGHTATFVQAQHFSGRNLHKRNDTLWGGFVLGTSVGSVFFAGDTGYGPHFTQIAARYGAPRLALLPIGAYAPRWFMRPVHMDPAEAVQAHRDLGAVESMGIHFGTFRLADEAFAEPAARLAETRSQQGVAEAAFWVPAQGESRLVDHCQKVRQPS